MTFRLSYRLVGFCIALVLCGCTQYLFIPNPSNIPLPSGKNEIKARTGISSGGLYFQGSYAPTNHIVIMGSYTSMFGAPDSTNGLTNNQFETIVGGYYKTFKTTRFEILGGYGIGHSWANYRIHTYFLGTKQVNGFDVNNNYKSFSIQADCGKFYKNFEGGLSFKLHPRGLKKPHFNSYTYVEPNHRDYSQLNYSLPTQALFAEPSIFLSAGSKFLKFQTIVGWSFPIGSQAETLSEVNYGAIVSGGITLSLFGPKEK